MVINGYVRLSVRSFSKQKQEMTAVFTICGQKETDFQKEAVWRLRVENEL
jgi:hypothetical protein